MGEEGLGYYNDEPLEAASCGSFPVLGALRITIRHDQTWTCKSTGKGSLLEGLLEGPLEGFGLASWILLGSIQASLN